MMVFDHTISTRNGEYSINRNYIQILLHHKFIHKNNQNTKFKNVYIQHSIRNNCSKVFSFDKTRLTWCRTKPSALSSSLPKKTEF